MHLMFVQQDDGSVLEVRVIRVHASMDEALSKACDEMLAGLNSRLVYRMAVASGDEDDQWMIKCSSIAVGWKKRCKRGSNGFIRPKSSIDWRASCRTMLSQWCKQHSRVNCDTTKWKQWAANTAGNHRKRIKWLANRKSNL